MSVAGMDSLDQKLKRLGDMDLERQVAKGIQIVRSRAVYLCPADVGELRQSIYADVENQGGIVTGTCYTNKAYAIFVEFGTGPKGQENHPGVSPDIAVSYSQSPWWIHESMIDKRIAEKYHWFSIDTKDGKFYQCSGQAAQPFMYPALHDSKDELLDMIKAEFKADLRKVIK